MIKAVTAYNVIESMLDKDRDELMQMLGVIEAPKKVKRKDGNSPTEITEELLNKYRHLKR